MTGRELGSMVNLDIGCGDSEKEGYMGIDHNKTLTTDCVMSGTSLGFKDNSIQNIYSRRCLQHIKDDQKALSEMYRVLEPNGRLELIVQSWRGWLFYKFRWMLQKKPYSVSNLYTVERLRKKLEGCRFSIVSLSCISKGKTKKDLCAKCVKK